MIKMDKRTIIIWVLVALIVGYFGYVTYNNQMEKAYAHGTEDALLYMQQQIYQNLAENGYVPFSYLNGEETQTINLVPYQQPEVS